MQIDYEAIAVASGFELKENRNTANNNGFYCVPGGDRDDAPTVYPTADEAWRACVRDYDLAGTPRALLLEAIEAWPQLDTEHEQVSGADLVEWFQAWRERAKAALVEARTDLDRAVEAAATLSPAALAEAARNTVD